MFVHVDTWHESYRLADCVVSGPRRHWLIFEGPLTLEQYEAAQSRIAEYSGRSSPGVFVTVWEEVQS